MSGPTDDDARCDQAMDWVLLLRSGRATEADAEGLQAWRAQHPDNDRAFADAVRTYRNLGTLGRQLERRQTQPVAHLMAGSRKMISRRGVLGGAIAASAAGYMLVNPPLGMWPSLTELSADYRTGKGEQRDIAIAENVSVRLNTLTSLAVRAAGDNPKIELIAGEAAVTATRGISSPLKLVAGSGQITAMQAVFNIRCIDGEVSATCLDGKIGIEQGGGRIELGRGQQVSYSPDRAIGAPVTIDTASAAAWREQLLIFRDQPLGSVVSEINRYRPGKIVVTNSDLGKRLVNGTFRTDKLDDFVAQVRQLFNADVRSLPGGIVLLS